MRLFCELDHDWTQVTRTVDANDALREWGRDNAALRDFSCLRELVGFIRQPDHPATSDDLLAALVRRAAAEPVAARVVLQALLPALRLIAISRCTADDAEEIDAVVIACAWNRIRCYPHDRRPRHIAANVVRDTRKDVTREYPFPADRLDLTYTLVDSAQPSCAGEEVIELLRDALGAGIIDHHEASLIARTRLGDETFRAIAAGIGLSAEKIRKQCRRAERRLGLVAR